MRHEELTVNVVGLYQLLNVILRFRPAVYTYYLIIEYGK